MARLLTLHDPAETRAYYRAGLWREETLYGLVERWAAERGDRPALRDPERRLTWAELKAEVDALAARLDSAGLRSGERVSVWMSNRVEAVILFLACSRGGYVFNTSLHSTYTVDEVAGLLERVRCSLLFAESGYGADGKTSDIFERASAVASVKAVIGIPGSNCPVPAGRESYRARSDGALPEASNDPDKIVYLAFTSGTTGAPKGVMHSDNSLLANARAMVEDWNHGPETILLTLSQMSHHIGTVALCQALAGGFELVLSNPAAGIATLDWIERSGATYIMGVPTHAIDLLAGLKPGDSGRLAAVRTFYMAGAPIPTATARSLLEMGIVPQNVYGMTENGSHQYTRPGDDAETITASCGKSCSAYEIRLFDPVDRDVEAAHGEVGEIGGRGAMRMLGYFDNQSATEDGLNSAGWFMSGDLGRFDSAGNLEIVGRAKDIIIRGGHNIHPAKIEDLAMQHCKVIKAAAVAVPDERLGEKVCLLITASGDAPAGSELLDHLAARGLSKYDMPEYLKILDSFPLGPTGKVLKRELANLIREGKIIPDPVRWAASPEGAER